MKPLAETHPNLWNEVSVYEVAEADEITSGRIFESWSSAVQKNTLDKAVVRAAIDNVLADHHNSVCGKFGLSAWILSCSKNGTRYYERG